jgi:hypothetical protein
MAYLASRSLLGNWNLVSWEMHSADGTVSNRWGRIQRESSRTTRLVGCQFRSCKLTVFFESADAFKAAPAEIVAAWLGFLAYAGGYENDPSLGTVIHHLEICSFPNWVGGRQERFYSFDGDLLVLSTPPISLGGDSTVSTLLWEPMRRS